MQRKRSEDMSQDVKIIARPVLFDVSKKDAHEQQFSKLQSYSPWDQFLIWLGAKMSPTIKTSPLEWNGKVVALLGALLIMAVTCGSLIWYASGLASDLRHLQSDVNEIKADLKAKQIAEQAVEIRKAEARGYQLKEAEGDHGKEQK